MIIDKKPVVATGFRRSYHSYGSARSAFKAYLASLDLSDNETVLLPSYIGWSAREGSGVFDPIAELALQPEFYKLNDKLLIDVDDCRSKIIRGDVKVVVLIHYFGFVDPSYQEIVTFARERGVAVMEDEAHAMLTDLVGGISGRLGDVSIFSLHKLLPLSSGGALIINNDASVSVSGVLCSDDESLALWNYDLQRIASRRLANALSLVKLLEKHGAEVDILRVPRNGEIPQTLPVIIKNVDRNRLYNMMNEAGYGVVSLYHTLIDRINKDDHPDVHFVASRIMNLPVHQDIDVLLLPKMVDTLMKCIGFLKAR